MVIRTQNKKILIDVADRLIEVGGYQDNNKEIYLMSEMGRIIVILGEYATHERAMEVLGEIAKAWNKTEQAKVQSSDVVITPSFVYQMPQE